MKDSLRRMESRRSSSQPSEADIENRLETQDIYDIMDYCGYGPK